ncbi:MAG: hypothetical protein QOI89_1469 [Solirubrobacteraceae bacterium]|nr:hypothetical protein [Solirubrobacteraceae bacterium]
MTLPLRLWRALRSALLPAVLVAMVAGISQFPAPASATKAHAGRSASRATKAKQRCVARRASGRRARTRPHPRGRGSQTCVRPVVRRPASLGAPRRPLEATSLYGGGQASPGGATMREAGAAASPSPRAGGGPGGKPAGRLPLPVESGGVVNDPIDPRFLTYLPFGTRSFWLQPWRAYLDTWPASRLLESVGINFNVSPQVAEPTAQLLQESGFRLARVGINWSALSYEDPTSFLPSHLASITARLTALRNHGLRPLIVLDAYSGAPTPEKHLTLETSAPAAAGSQTVNLTAASAARVVPGKTGFNGLTFGGSPDVLITSVGPTGVAALSRPLQHDLPAGAHGATTLLYAPFQAPTRSDGTPNPEFQATLDGWLKYVRAVCGEAAGIVGAGGFDLEVWNELTFGSQFLNSENYYSTPPESRARTAQSAAASSASASEAGASPAQAASSEEEASAAGPEEVSETEYRSDAGSPEGEYATEGTPEVEEGPASEGAVDESGEAEAASSRTAKSHRFVVNGEVHKALLAATVAYVRDPANGISPAVGITNGFASQTPFPSGAAAPLGLTALSKHPYVAARTFPAELREGHIVSLNAQGLRDSPKGVFAPLFAAHYESLLPEYTLAGVSTETLIRDLAPITTKIYGFPHGRAVGPPGGSPVQKWITEYNLSLGGKAAVVGPDGVTPQSGGSATLSTADKAHAHAKALLRSLVAMVSKGVSREYFFAAAPGSLSLISEAFFSAIEAHPGTYPGSQLGGETMDGFRNLLARFQGPGAGGEPRQLTLSSIAQEGDHAQFTGDGTSAHPSLYDRDVLAVFPFQASPTRYVIPVYVMTRNLLTLYEPGASPSDISRFDLPDETFRITLGNLPQTGSPPTVSAYDPLHNRSTPARLLSREGSSAVFEVAATDYPRLLSVDYAGG